MKYRFVEGQPSLKELDMKYKIYEIYFIYFNIFEIYDIYIYI